VECRYASLDADVDHLLQLSCFGKPGIKLTDLKDRAEVMKDTAMNVIPVNKSELN